MTGPGSAGEPTDPDGPDGGTPVTIAVFSLEGRAVPGLYLVGWLGTLGGGALLAVSFLAAGGAASPWLFLAGTALLAIGLLAAGGSQAVEGSRRVDLAYRGPSPLIAFGAVIALTLLGVIVFLAPASALGLDPRSPLSTAISLAITAAAYAGVVRLLVVGPGALAWGEMGLGRSAPGAIRDLAIGASLALPVLVVTGALALVLARFLEPAPSPLPPAVDAAGLLLNLATAAVLAPLGEELFFRGFATTAWARSIGAGPAILRGAVFFALAHVVTLFDASFAVGVQRAAFSFLALLPVGIALGWLFLARRSLWAAVGLHAAFNAIQLVALAASGGAGT